MDITLKNFIMKKSGNGQICYIHLHNTVTTSYSGDIRTIVICNLSKECWKAIKKEGDKMFIEEANGFMSVMLKNARPTPVLVFNSIKVGKWEEQNDNNGND